MIRGGGVIYIGGGGGGVSLAEMSSLSHPVANLKLIIQSPL